MQPTRINSAQNTRIHQSVLNRVIDQENEKDIVTATALEVINRDPHTVPKIKIFKAVDDVSAQERVEVVENRAFLTVPKMNRFDAVQLHRANASGTPPVSEEEAALALEWVDSFSTENLKALGEVPAHERGDVLHYSLRLIDPKMPDGLKTALIRKMASLPKGERGDYVKRALFLRPPRMRMSIPK